MRNFLLTLSLTALLSPALAQQTEFRGALTSSLFSFTGPSAQASTFINYSDVQQRGYTNNPYGSRAGLGYGLALNVQRVTRQHLLFGFEVGSELLRSKIALNSIAGATSVGSYTYGATGHTYLNNTFLNFSPFLGYRIPARSLNFDLSAGFDLAYCLKAEEKGTATDFQGTTYETSVDRRNTSFDFRPRLQLAASYQSFGLFAGYSIGQVNYMSGYVGGPAECTSRLLRFGLSYRFGTEHD